MHIALRVKSYVNQNSDMSKNFSTNSTYDISGKSDRWMSPCSMGKTMLFRVTAIRFAKESGIVKGRIEFTKLKERQILRRKSNKGLQVEHRNTSTLSLTLALDGVGLSTPRLGRFNPGKVTRYPLYRRLCVWAPEPVWTGKNSSDTENNSVVRVH
jgi:hypothetical protein